MRGLQGVVIAGAFGIVGAVSNWLYIAQQADRMERVSFIAIEADAQVNVGDRFREQHFQKVDIPKNRIGNLDQIAVLWRDRLTAVGLPSARSYLGGEILLRQDLETPAKRDLNDLIGADERVLWLPVDSRTFNPQHVNPGDEVSFKIPNFATVHDEPAADVTPAGSTGTSSHSEIIGPFRILALGNRKGRLEVRRASGMSGGAENVLAISVKIAGNALEPKAERISEILQLTNFQGVQVLLHPAGQAKDGAR